MGARPICTFVAAALLAGCSTVITIPDHRGDVRTIYLLDLGRHSRLGFERPGGGLVEYGYGEWRWYARLEDAWWRVPAVLFWPTRGTLGRREWPGPRAEAQLRRTYGNPAVLELPADKRKADSLLARLDREFARNSDCLVRNRLYGLDFVPSERGYSLFHNSNHAVKQWLQAAGLEVTGSGVIASWRLAD